MSHAAYRRRSQRILEAAGYRVTRASDSLGEWDLIGMNHAGVVLVCVTDSDLDERTKGNLFDCPTPADSAKLLHRWKAKTIEKL